MEGFLGGSGGACTFGGGGDCDSKLMSGAVLDRKGGLVTFLLDGNPRPMPLALPSPFACPFCFCAGPSSTTQSFRSISDVFRPRFGGDGEREAGGLGVLEGVIG